ncbi:MAG: hypothetical protein HUJ72_08930 [Blautia sp.]|nr:hypothetical protein [Blautia sp.]
MKRLLNLALLLLFAMYTFPQISGVGYYRVCNAQTKYYMYVTDNTGKISIQTTDAEMGALQLYKDQDLAITNPASVIYFNSVQKSGSEYICNFEAQGVDVVNLIGYHVHVYPTSAGHYQVYATSSGMTKYLDDENTNATIPSYLGYFHSVGTTKKSDLLRSWDVLPISTSSNNYVAIKPTMTISGRHFAPYYASYPFTLSQGMKAYVVTKIDAEKKVAVYAALPDGQVIPASTPVLVECVSTDVAQNKITLQKPGQYKTPPTNLLKGVYFCNDFRPNSKDAHTLYNPQTMRVFGTTSDGKMGFVNNGSLLHVNDYVSNGWDEDDGKRYLHANQAYLSIPSSTPDELTLLSEEEYAALAPSVLRGDVNGDGKVNMFDVQVLFTHVLSGTANQLQLNAADYDADGKVLMLDVQKLFIAVLSK